MKIINVPLYDIIFGLIESSKYSIKLCSPFIKSEIVDQIYKTAKDYCEISVITNVNLMSMYKKSSDIDALNTILHRVVLYTITKSCMLKYTYLMTRR